MASLSGNTWLYKFEEMTEKIDMENRVGLWENCLITYNCGIPTKVCETTDLSIIPGKFQNKIQRIIFIMDIINFNNLIPSA